MCIILVLDDGISMFDERYNQLKTGKRRQRGGMLLEAMCAVVILTIAFLAWAGSMMGASQGQYHAAKHTESIEIANYYLEQVRRDPLFFGSEFLGLGNCNGSNCWQTGNNSMTDACNVAYPPYTDAGPYNGGGWHPGCQNLTLETNGVINEPYNYQWRADIHCKGGTCQDVGTADITVWVETQTLHGGWDTYVVTGLKKAPRS
jgi:type II secretory pathway pseudopilin PulG